MTKATEKQIAWLAGIIDGEGCLAICKVRRPKDSKKGIGYRVMVSITNANLDIINAAKNVIANVIGKVPYVYSPRKYKENLRQCFRVQITTQSDIVKLLTVVYSDLVGKRSHADLLIEFCMSRLTAVKCSGRYAEYSNNELDVVRKIKRVNHLLTVESGGESPANAGEGAFRTSKELEEVAEMTTRQRSLFVH